MLDAASQHIHATPTNDKFLRKRFDQREASLSLSPDMMFAVQHYFYIQSTYHHPYQTKPSTTISLERITPAPNPLCPLIPQNILLHKLLHRTLLAMTQNHSPFNLPKDTIIVSLKSISPLDLHVC